MCLAIYKPADTAADWKSYENGYDDNPHSWGFAAVVDGKLVTRCGIGKFAEFRSAFEPYAHCKAIIHFRFATHGSKTEANCHPFLVAPDLAVIHNGIISIKCDVHSDRSDTWHFNELVLKPMHLRDPDFFLRPEIRYTQELAHRGSKFIFLRADGMHDIWAEGDGHWETDGHWYSNTGYRYSRYTYYTYGNSSGSVSRSLSCHRDMSPPAADEPVMSTREIEIDMEYEQSDRVLIADYDESEEGTILRDPYEYDDMPSETLEGIAQTLLDHGYSHDVITEVYDIGGKYALEALRDSL